MIICHDKNPKKNKDIKYLDIYICEYIHFKREHKKKHQAKMRNIQCE
jgi:hypothetical protein